MLKLTKFGLAFLTVVALAPAQDVFQIYPKDAPEAPFAPTFSRLGLGTSAGELLMSVPDSPGHDFFRGVGRDCVDCRIQGASVTVQDLGPWTPETFRVVVRKNLASGLPDMTPGGIMVQSAWVATTPFPGVPAVQFQMNVAFPCTAIPCTGGFSMGIEVLASPTYPADGLEIGKQDYTLAATQGDYPIASAPTYAYWDAVPLAVAAPAGNGMSLEIGVIPCDAPLLNMGNIGMTRGAGFANGYGVGGMWQDAAPRGDGLAALVHYTPHANGFAFLAVSFGWATTPLSLTSFGMCEDLYLDLLTMFVLPLGTLDANGRIEVNLLPPAIRTTFVGNAAVFQAFTLAPSTSPPMRVTNAQKVQW